MDVFGLRDRVIADYTSYIRSFFTIRDERIADFGEYRTKRLVLERYNALVEAITSGKPYVSPLSPPPGDRWAAHKEK